MVEHADLCPTTLETSLQKWQRYCVIMRTFSLVCVKRWNGIFALSFIRLAIQSFWYAVRRKLRMLQEHNNNPQLNFTHAPCWEKSKMQLRSAAQHTLYSKHIFRKLIHKMHTHRNTEKRQFCTFVEWKKKRWQTNSGTVYQRVKERYAYSTLCLPTQTLLTECRT